MDKTGATIKLLPALEGYVRALLAEGHLIPSPRKEKLLLLAGYIREGLARTGRVRLNFICTHNSRRSHLAQIWTSVAARYFGLNGIETYSGGTEATAFNPRAVAALERAGFRIENPGGHNPAYRVYFSLAAPPMTAWSKTFDDPVNPNRGFAAIMTCSDADENCPFIPGAASRLPLTYEDPKEADGTAEEIDRYDERVRQIGREIFWMMSQIS